MLRGLLTHVGALVHDKVEKVRVAVVKMLIAVKALKTIKYFDVVPVEHLTGRLAEEGEGNMNGPVASALTGLMANSYFPDGNDVSGAIQIKRTLMFLSKDPRAARVFYHNISQHISVKSVVKLMAMLLACLESAIQTEQKEMTSKVADAKQRKRRRFGKGDSGDEDTVPDGDAEQTDEARKKSPVTANNTSLMASLAETIDVLWQSIEKKLSAKEYSSDYELLVDKFYGTALMDILNHFERTAGLAGAREVNSALAVEEDCYRVCAAVLRCAARLPSEAIEGLVPHISTALAALSQHNGSALSLRRTTGFIAVLCLWDMTDQVGGALARSIESAFENDHSLYYEDHVSRPDTRKRRTGAPSRTSVVAVVPALSPLLALSVLGNILCGSDPSSIAAREALLHSHDASTAIRRALQRAIKYAELALTGTIVRKICAKLSVSAFDVSHGPLPAWNCQ